jgi:hypothetical protein
MDLTLPERGSLGAVASGISSVVAGKRSKATQIPDGPKESEMDQKKPATDRLRVWMIDELDWPIKNRLAAFSSQ